VLVPSVVPPLFGLSAELQFPLSVVCVALEPCPVVVVHVPCSNSLPWAGFTAPAGDEAASTPRVVNMNVAMQSFFFTDTSRDHRGPTGARRRSASVARLLGGPVLTNGTNP
jgi:hypothetical protein